MRTPTAFSLAAFLLQSVTALGAWDCAPPSGLLSSSTPLDWELRADFSVINDHAIELSEKDRASSDGTLIADGKRTAVTVSARGDFRFEECPHRPLAITPKEGNGPKLKLVVLCDPNPASREAETRKLLKEYVIYRMLSQLPGPSLQARLVRLKMTQPDGRVILEAPAFLREPEDALAERCGLKKRGRIVRRWDEERRTLVPWTVKKGENGYILRRVDYQPDEEALLRAEFAHRFVNNFDYSVAQEHNLLTLLSEDREDKRVVYVAYDFDLSQAAGGTFYTYLGTPRGNAQSLASWIMGMGIAGLSEKPAELHRSVIRDFISAAPAMRQEILASPLDAAGRDEMLEWLDAHRAALQ